MKTNNFRGELTDISAKKEALLLTMAFCIYPELSAENSVCLNQYTSHSTVSPLGFQTITFSISVLNHDPERQHAPKYRPGVGKSKAIATVLFRHGAAQYTGDLEIIFHGYHLDRAIPIIQRPYIV